MKKQVVSVVLTLCMMLTFIPMTLLAASAQDVQYVVAGTSNLFGNAWDFTTESGNLMTQTESGKYELVISPTEACGSAKLRVAKLIDGIADSYYSNGRAEYIEINVSGGGDITISFDPSTEEITVSGDNVTVVTDLQISSIRAVGNGSGSWLHGSNWDPADDANLMTEASSGVYEITYTGVSANNAYQFSFAADSSWTNSWGGSIDSENAVFGGNNITFAVEQDNSTVKLVLDLTNYDHSTQTGATYKVYVNGTQIKSSPAFQVSSMRAVGNGSGSWLHGSSWSVEDDANLMSEASSGVYEITYTGVSANNSYQFKFVADGLWQKCWSGSIDSESAVLDDAGAVDAITFAVEQDNSTVKLVLDLTNYDHSTQTGATYKVYVNGTQINGSSSASNTQTGSCGANATYTLDKTTGALTISGTGEIYDYASNGNPSPFSSSTDVKSVTIGEGITGIGNYLFYQCSKLTTVTLPSTLEEIGEDAFYGCYDLKDIYFTGTIDDVTENLNDVSSGNSYYYEATKHYIETPVVSVTHDKPFFRGFNKYYFTVEGRASKLQVIYPNGATYTVSRHSALSTGTNVKGLVSIKSYDANDNEVSNGSADIEYEIWTINMNLAEGKYTVKAKYGDKWDSVAKKFTVNYETGAKVASVKLNGTANGGYNLYSVKINGSASKVQVLLPNGGTYTFDRSEKLVTGNSRGVVSIKAYDKNNKEVALGSADTASELWVINMLLKEGSYTVKAKYKTTWETTGKAFTVSYPTKATDEVKITKAEGKDGSCSFKVNGTAQKLQIVYANGATSTFSKTNSGVNVKYYNNKKVEVDKYSGEVAYELWTVSKKLADGSYKAIVKYHNGTTYVWGTTALEFDIELGELTANIDGAKTEAELIEALEAVKQTGGTVTLADDITLSQTLMLSDYGTNESLVTLDLNDFTITGNIFVSNGFVTIQNGTVNYTLPEELTSESDLAAIISFYSYVELKNLTVNATDAFAVLNSSASTIIEDCTLNGKLGERIVEMMELSYVEGLTVFNNWGRFCFQGEIEIEHKISICSDTDTSVAEGCNGTIDGVAFEATEDRYFTSADPFVKELNMA